MSQQLISRNPDLKKLRDGGYDIEVRSKHLLIKNVPYINLRKEIKYGTLVSGLTMAGDSTTTPDTHVAYFIGEHPCHKDGGEIRQIQNQSGDQALDKDLVVNHTFSSKPTSGAYKDYHEKVSTYVAIISSPAQSVDPSVTATTFPPIEPSEEETVFNYFDTASSRAGISAVTSKLGLNRVAVVGLGGTGSYVLDLIAKTPIKEINIFDGDLFLNHNAFRSPGAPSIDELRSKIPKVTYFKERYSRMHRNIISHDCFIDATNVDQLQGMDFVFLCLDRGEAKKRIVEKLEAMRTPFIDVGIGVQLVDDALIGVLRITTSTADKREHVKAKGRIPFSDGDENNEYSRNIQIADLNALNAAFAVIKWKKIFGFYRDFENEHHSTYTIDGNCLINEDHP